MKSNVVYKDEPFGFVEIIGEEEPTEECPLDSTFSPTLEETVQRLTSNNNTETLSRQVNFLPELSLEQCWLCMGIMSPPLLKLTLKLSLLTILNSVLNIFTLQLLPCLQQSLVVQLLLCFLTHLSHGSSVSR